MNESKYRVSPQYSPYGRLEAYKVEKFNGERWVSVRTCMTKDAAERFVSEQSPRPQLREG